MDNMNLRLPDDDPSDEEKLVDDYGDEVDVTDDLLKK